MKIPSSSSIYLKHDISSIPVVILFPPSILLVSHLFILVYIVFFPAIMHCHILSTFILLICCMIVSAHPGHLGFDARDEIASADVQFSENSSLPLAEHNLPSTETDTLQSDDGSLSRRSVPVDKLPVNEKCKSYLGNKLLPAATKAYEYIVDEVCVKGGCKLKFSDLYKKYKGFVIDMVNTCVVHQLERGGVTGLSKQLNTRSLLNKVAEKCFASDPQVMAEQNICESKESVYNRVRGCVLPEILGLVPSFMVKNHQICRVAEERRLEIAVGRATCSVSS